MLPGHVDRGAGGEQRPEVERALAVADRDAPRPPKHVLLGLDLEQLGRDPGELLAQFARRLQHRVAGHVELAGGDGRPGQRGERAVADVDGDPLRGHAEHLGGDLGQRCGLAAADVGHPDPDRPGCRPARGRSRRGPVVEPDTAAVRLQVAGEASPDGAARRARLRRRLEPLCDRLEQRRDLDRGLERLSDRQHVTALDEVAPAHLEWVDAERGREPVHLPLVAEGDLHGAEAAHRAAGVLLV